MRLTALYNFSASTQYACEWSEFIHFTVMLSLVIVEIKLAVEYKVSNYKPS